jgi:fibronectin-binding autotransporter adhesin
MRTNHHPIPLTSNLTSRLRRFGSLLAALTVGANLYAASGTWTNLVSGSGAGSWGAPANWNNSVIADGVDSTADFSTLDITTTSTVTLDGARTIGNLSFGDTTPGNNWSLTTGSGGPLTLAVTSGQPTLTANNGSNTITAVLASPLSSAGLTKNGSGTVRLGSANLLTNINANVNAGVLLLAQNNALGYLSAAVGSNYVVAGATLQLAAGVQPVNQRIFLSGTGLGGTNGALRADAGTGNQQNTRWSFALNSVANPSIVLTGDATIRVDGSGHTTHAGFLVGAITNNMAGLNYTLTKSGAAELRVDPGVNIAASNLVIAEGVIGFNGSGNVSGAQNVIVNSGAVAGARRNTAFNSAASVLVLNGILELCYNPGAVNDAVGFDQRIGVLTGGGTVRNAIQNNYTTLRVQSATSNSVFAGTFDTPYPTNGPIVLRKSGAGTSLQLTGSATYRGTNFVEAGTLIVDGAMNPSGGYVVNSGAVLSGAGTIAGPILVNFGGTLAAGSPTGTLTVSNVAGAGDVILSNANLSVSTAIGSLGNNLNSLSLTNGKLTVPLAPGGPSVFANTVTVDGNVTIAYTSGNPSVGQFPLISYGSLGGLAGGDTNGLTLLSPAGTTAYLSNNAANLTLDVVVTAVPALKWNGNVNGDWNIAGTANWLNGASASTYTETAGEGPFVNFDDTATGTTAVNLTTTVTPKGTTVNNTAKNYTFSGSGLIAGSAGLLKQGTGTLTLANSGANSFAGPLSIAAGTVQVGAGGTTGSLGTGSVDNSGQLAFDRSDSVTFANAISGAGSLSKAGAGTVTLTGIGNVGGAITVNGGVLALAPAGAITVTGDVTGTGAFGVTGAGTVILDSATVSYAGGTIITNGTLQLNNSFPPAGNIVDFGTLAVGVSGTLANNISGGGGVAIINNAGVTLGGANTYSGTTKVFGALTADAANYPASSPLQLGSITGGTDIGSATFMSGNPVLGGLSAGGNSGSPGNPLVLAGSNQKLTINGNVSVGNAAIGASVYLPVTGSGATVEVNTNGGVIQIGLSTAGSGVNPDNVFVDLTGVETFVANLGATGQVNLGTLDGNPGPPAGATVVNWFKLASVSNFITAGSITVGAGGRQLVPELFLGDGTNVIHVNSFNAGGGGRDGSYVHFNSGAGGLKLRGNDGASRAAFNVGVNPATGTGANITNTVDFSGHPVDLLLSSLVIGNYNNAGVYENKFTFDTGTLDAQTTSLSVLRNNNGNAAASGGTLTINGGSATLGAVNLTASAAYGTLTVANATSLSVSNITSPGSGGATFDLNNTPLTLNLGSAGGLATPAINVDTFNASGTINLGITGTGFTVGQHVLIKYTGSIGGSGFAALNLTSLPAGVTATLSNNTANASVDLVVTAAPVLINPNPGTILANVAGATLSLGWPTNSGWILQTNAVSVAAPSQWFAYHGSASVTNVNLTIDPAKTNVFFRLVHP